MDLTAGKYMALKRLDQRCDQDAARAHPAPGGGRIQIHTTSRVNDCLPVQRLMIGEFADRDIGQQTRTSEAAGNRAAWCRRLDDAVAAGAGFLASHMTNGRPRAAWYDVLRVCTVTERQ